MRRKKPHRSPGTEAHRRGAGARRPLLRFGATFAAVCLGLYTLYQISESTHHFRHVNVLNAVATARILDWVGIGTTRMGTQVHVGRGAMEIISECSAVYVLILFVAAVVAYPAPWRARAWGLGLGVPLLLGINVLRLVTLGLVIAYRASLLPLFHEYLWQVFFILVVAVLYCLWIERITPREKPGPAA